MKRLFRKLFPKKPVYEPAGIVHYGEFHWVSNDTQYGAFNQPNGTIEIWADGKHIGTYPKDGEIIEIIDHAKENK